MDKAIIEDQAASVAGDIKATVGGLACDASTRVEELASQAAATAERVYDRVQDEVRGAATAAATTVEKQPLVALMAVGLICGVVGFLLARGRH
jgi:uncharacterized protein YjbJ (UPF0337 family)